MKDEDLEKLSLSELIEERVKAEKAVIVFVVSEEYLAESEKDIDAYHENAKQMRVYASEVSMEIRKRLTGIQKIIKGRKTKK